MDYDRQRMATQSQQLSALHLVAMFLCDAIRGVDHDHDDVACQAFNTRSTCRRNLVARWFDLE